MLYDASYRGRGWLKTSEYRHMGGRVLKLLKNRHMIFERSLIALKHLIVIDKQ